MASRDPSTTPDQRRQSGSATDSPGKDGLDRVELSDLDSSPPQLPVEQDLMQLARLGELRGIQKLFDSGRYTAKSADEQGITALHVRGGDLRARDEGIVILIIMERDICIRRGISAKSPIRSTLKHSKRLLACWT